MGGLWLRRRTEKEQWLREVVRIRMKRKRIISIRNKLIKPTLQSLNHSKNTAANGLFKSHKSFNRKA